MQATRPEKLLPATAAWARALGRRGQAGNPLARRPRARRTGLAEEHPAQEDEVGLPAFEDGLGLERLGDQADGSGPEELLVGGPEHGE